MDRAAAPPLPALALPDPGPEVARLAHRYRRANGPVMAVMNRIGGEMEKQLAHLPPAFRARVDEVVMDALARAAQVAALGRHAPRLGPAAAPAVAALTGAAGGAGGLPTALAELPVTVTLILHSIARAAADEGFDPDTPEVRAECLRVLGSGSPLARDDGVNTSFLSARLTMTGPAMHKLLSTVAPGLAAVLTQKLAAQAVPVLGALTGAALNTAFLRYYRELAHIRFALLRLAGQHGAAPVLAAFRAAVEPPRVTRA